MDSNGSLVGLTFVVVVVKAFEALHQRKVLASLQDSKATGVRFTA